VGRRHKGGDYRPDPTAALPRTARTGAQNWAVSGCHFLV